MRRPPAHRVRLFRVAALVALVAMPLAAASCGGSTSSTFSTSSTSSTSVTPASSSSSSWVRDSVGVLDIYLPDADSDYYINGYGTADGARTVISGAVPEARYWSFTAYPTGSGSSVRHVHDTAIIQRGGRYTVTLSASCVGVSGTCLATGTGGQAGILVMRLYVPVDVAGSGTGGVPLPAVTYVSHSGMPVSLAQASGTGAVAGTLAVLRQKDGALPAALTKSYPPPAPVPTPVADPPPVGVISSPTGPFANPDNVYDHMAYTSTRGDLVVSAQAPTYQSDPAQSDPAQSGSANPANDLARPASDDPQVRYWSLCAVLKGRHTGDCLRDEQVHIPAGSSRFTVIVAPTCPVAGYLNCIDAGPEPLQQSLSYRNLLPSPSFAPLAFRGPFALTGAYVARPG